MKYFWTVLLILFWSFALADKPVQLDIYNTGPSTSFIAGGAFAYRVYDLGQDLATPDSFPVYGRFGIAMGSNYSRFTLGADAMSPWFFGLFRVQAGAGLEVDSIAADPTEVGPYVRMGSQLWVFFGDFDFSLNTTHYAAGIRLEF